MNKPNKKKQSTKTKTKFLGDEIIEWNGQTLHNRSAEDVYDIISDSRYDPQVDLIVSRTIAANRKAAQASWRQSHSPTRLTGKGIVHIIKLKTLHLHSHSYSYP